MYPHRIRLRGPWDCEPVARLVRGLEGRVEWTTQELPAPFRINMPGRVGLQPLGDFAGRVRLRRKFGIPRQLDAHEHVWLTFASIDSSASISLNGRVIAELETNSSAFEHDVTGLLGERNELSIEMATGEPDNCLCQEVALEIRALAFLREVSAWLAARHGAAKLHVTGRVVGCSDQTLEIYAILGRSTVAYSKIEAAASGQSFYLISEPLDFTNRGHCDVGPVRIELVHGGTVWYAFDTTPETVKENEG